MFEIRLNFHWQYSSIGSDNGLAPNRRQTIIRTNDDPVQRRIYASLGLYELKRCIEPFTCYYGPPLYQTYILN